jgi:hypothetical protein
MINDLEALLLRGFANDLLNTWMEKFSSSTLINKNLLSVRMNAVLRATVNF